MSYRTALLGVVLAAAFGSASAQAPIIGVEDATVLFTSADPKLKSNKQRRTTLLNGGRWEEADKLLTERYIQHNPNVPSTVH